MRHPAGTELLDDPAADPVAVRTSLGNIARANRLFGGTAAVLYGVDRLLSLGATSEAPVPVISVLDIGTGAGDIPCALRAWGGRSARMVRTFGLERLRPAARLARTAELSMTLGCATSLPFRSRGVDVVTLSQVLHHFEPEAAVRLLAEAVRVARCGVVVADLLRSRAAATLFGVGARVLGFDTHTVADGITSVG
ncbi:MAG TPA: methyltransferase domain-containing protein, partial [Gemmatimonadales bacterium]